MLVHADAPRVIHLTNDKLAGHLMRYGYNIGPLTPPVQQSTHRRIEAREIVELSRDVALEHVGQFVAVLRSIPRSELTQ